MHTTAMKTVKTLQMCRSGRVRFWGVKSPTLEPGSPRDSGLAGPTSRSWDARSGPKDECPQCVPLE